MLNDTFSHANLSHNATSGAEGVAISSYWTLKIIYFFIGSLGLVGNALVLIVLASSRSMRQQRTNLMIMNQSAVDFNAALFLILTTAMEQDIPGNAAYCALWLTKLPLWSMLVSSTYSLLLITVERYFAVVHAVWHKNHVGQCSVVVGISTAWLIGPLYNAAYMIPSSKLLPEDGTCSVFSFFPTEQIRQGVGLFTFVLQFLIPIVILVFCYGRMAHCLWSRLKVVPGGSQQQSTSDAEKRKRGPLKNVVKTLILVSCCFVLCWVCNQVYYLLFNLGAQLNFTNDFYHFTVVAVFCNCCINPVVIMAQYKQFQKGFRKLFRYKERGETNTNTTMSVNVTD